MTADAAASDEEARLLLKRSTVLLVSGIVMAFVGIAVFASFIPDENPVRRLESVAVAPVLPAPSTESVWTNVFQYASHALRPLGMLIFIEAVAWFLLRQ